MLNFSLIVPVYNCEKYLDECIASILMQTHTKYEIILVDDGSTDKSGLICDHYAVQYPEKVIVAHNQNQGPYLSRLYGVHIAAGDIILFLDSDDTLRPNALEILESCFAENNCDMVIFNAGKSPDFLSKEIIHPFEDGVLFEGSSKKILYRKMVESRDLNSVVLKAVRKDCAWLPDCIPQNCRLMHGEDLLLSASFITSSRRIKHIKQGLYHYRSRPESITHSYSEELCFSLKTVHLIFDELIKLWEMPELIPLHNTRKVSGWMDIIVIMLKAKPALDKDTIIHSLQSMANDPYFTSAYGNMDQHHLTPYYRVLAYCMHNKFYHTTIVLFKIKAFLSHVIRRFHRSFHGR